MKELLIFEKWVGMMFILDYSVCMAWCFEDENSQYSDTIKPLKVVAGIIRNSKNQILLGQRRPGTHLEGLWEFPGGKVEANETLEQALKRELEEELGIQVLTTQPLTTVEHQYPEKRILLHVLEVLTWQGEVQSQEQQALQWVNPESLSKIKMPEADIPVVSLL